MVQLIVTPITEENRHLTFTNCIYLSKENYNLLGRYVNIKTHIFNTRVYDTENDKLVLNGIHRIFLGLSNNSVVDVNPYHPKNIGPINTLTVEVFYLNLNHQDSQHIKYELIVEILKRFDNYIFDVGNKYLIEIEHGKRLIIQPTDMDIINVKLINKLNKKSDKVVTNINAGIYEHDKTIVNIVRNHSNPLSLDIEKPQHTSIFKFNSIDYEKIGIGGISGQFDEVFRRIFASRLLHPSIIKKHKIKHNKGLILYGPPGGGKTLLARSICQMLNCREPKIVNGPEILNKFVGASEENVRALFKDAIEEYRAKGEMSDLHIIIFDEIDSICRNRGSSTGGTNVGDTVVNQLLTMIDGVNSPDNLLIIGMTNRLDLIDEAMLRQGRFGVQIEISLPDKKGRIQIFNIHTCHIRENNMLDQEVDIDVLAEKTKNYTGAEIEGVVKEAYSYVIHREIDYTNLTQNISELKTKISMDDFDRAIGNIKPTFGISISGFPDMSNFQIYNKHYQSTIYKLESIIQKIEKSKFTNLISVLLTGEVGCGTTYLASHVALNSQFPFIKSINPKDLLSLNNEYLKTNRITKIFHDSYKSPSSIILLDDIERLIEYVPIGPRFSNHILQTLMILLTSKPDPKSNLVILATSSSLDLLERLGMLDIFSHHIHLSNMDSEGVEYFSKIINKEVDLLEFENTTIRDLLVKLDTEN